jgi:hypothetical protein
MQDVIFKVLQKTFYVLDHRSIFSFLRQNLQLIMLWTVSEYNLLDNECLIKKYFIFHTDHGEVTLK